MPEGFWLPGGRVLAAADGDSVALPEGVVGEVSLFLPGRVPSTIALDGTPGSPTSLHPLAEAPPPQATITATFTAHTSPAEAGLLAGYTAAGRRRFAGTATDVDGALALTVEALPDETGLVVVRDATGRTPRVGLMRVTPGAGANQEVGAIALQPAGLALPLPVPPFGLHTLAAHLLADLGAPGRATVLSLSAGPMPRYNLGIPLVVSYEAVSDDGLRTAFTGGDMDAVAPYLEAPDLSRLVGRVRAGAALTWPSVSGATLYTVRLLPAADPDRASWEAVVTRPRVTVPLPLALGAGDYVLRVEAWDAPHVSTYALATLRALRLPVESEGGTGRATATLLPVTIR